MAARQPTLLTLVMAPGLRCPATLELDGRAMQARFSADRLAAPPRWVMRNVRGIGDVRVGWRDLDETPEPWPQPELLPPRATEAVLTSALQKAVRRFDESLALRAAWTLLCLNPVAALRRLPVIMVEDAEVTEDLTFLVWCMLRASTRGHELPWRPPRVVVDRLLGVVAAMTRPGTRNDWRDMERPSPLPGCIEDVLGRWDPQTPAYQVAWAARARAVYGGMVGDVAMLNTLAVGAQQLPLAVRGAAPPLPGPRPALVQQAEDVPWYAADFHCAPWMLHKFPGMSAAQVKQRMWSESSGINLRVPGHRPLDAYALRAQHEQLARWALAQWFT